MTAAGRGDATLPKGQRLWAAPLRKDLRLWGGVMLFLSLFRGLFLLLFAGHLADATGSREILTALLYGLRYDCMVAGYVVALPLLLDVLRLWIPSLTLSERLRPVLGHVFLGLATMLCLVSLRYYQEFGTGFNHFLFIGMQDDTEAILATVWKEYQPLRMLLLLACGWWAGAKLLFPLNTDASDGPSFPWLRRIGLSLALLALVVLSARGSWGQRPAQRVDAAVTPDRFLNEAVLNPFVALNYAFKDHAKLVGASGLQLFLPDGDVRAALQRLYPEHAPSDRLDDYLTRTASGPKGRVPRHIYLLMMESYDSWPMLDAYAELRLCEGLKSLAAEGISVPAFLAGSPGTMASVSAVLTGLPDTGVQTDLQPQSQQAYTTALAKIFADLGYRTRFYYGGKLGWRNIDRFALAQGFEEVYGGAHMGDWQQANEWGVDDEFLFEFVAEDLDDSAPTFNFVLSTTYHPPYDVDVRAKGYAVEELPAELAQRHDGRFDLETWGHLWYADRVMTDFIRATEVQLPDSLFVITGDHYARKPLDGTPTLYEGYSVPLVFYGPSVLQGIEPPAHMAGSHFDLPATLVELAAPAGTPYPAMGRDLLAPAGTPLGLRRNLVIGPDWIARLSRPPQVEGLPFASDAELPTPAVLDAHRQRLNDLLGVAWWRVRNGPGIPPVRD